MTAATEIADLGTFSSFATAIPFDTLDHAFQIR
jgi:hypothetical protein